ncbi:MAG: hypothetical protein LBV22_00395 [Mycoplasmataceae bacterium]|jgi:hypothetical protein|nr:hypothetical protein [Mycoplasmataceae bacterium]
MYKINNKLIKPTEKNWTPEFSQSAVDQAIKASEADEDLKKVISHLADK